MDREPKSATGHEVRQPVPAVLCMIVKSYIASRSELTYHTTRFEGAAYINRIPTNLPAAAPGRLLNPGL